MTQEITPPRLSQDSLARILDVTQKLAEPFDLDHMLTERELCGCLNGIQINWS